MKRSDEMSKEETFDLFNNTISGDCFDCPVEIKTFCKKINNGFNLYGCADVVKKYLFDEVQTKTVSRWQTIKSDEGLIKMQRDYRGMCNGRGCSGCLYSSSTNDCFVDYLSEKIEVEDE